jgi:hypothetical protein
MSPTVNPGSEPTKETVPDSEYLPDTEEAGADPLEPFPMDGRDAQPAVGSSDDGAAMSMDDPLREAVYVEEEDLPFVDEEVEELEDEGNLFDPDADRLANLAIKDVDDALRRGESDAGTGEALES